MTLEQLRIFVAVAECQHVTAAARSLRLTQSAVSAAIHALQARHAVNLFDRVGRHVVLTAAGRQFLIEARNVLAQAAAAEAALDELAGLKRGSLHLAASQTVAHYWLPSRLAQYKAAYPGIALSVRIGNSGQVRQWLAEGAIDLGFVEDEICDPALLAAVVATDAVAAVIAPALMPAGTVDAAALKALSWVMREKGSGTRAVFEAALPSLGLSGADLNVGLELPSNEAVRAAAEAGAGATALSRLVVEQSLASGRLVPLEIPAPPRHFFMVRKRVRTVGPAEAALHRLVLPAAMPIPSPEPADSSP